MKIARAGYGGKVVFGRIESDLFHAYEPTSLARLMVGQPPRERHTVELTKVRLQAPVPQPGKLVCIGLNYRDHCEEQNIPIPERPVIFAKFASSITDPFATVLRPPETTQLDYEAELAVIIGTPGQDIPVERALDHVFGYTILNDISARDLQFADSQWIRGKNFPTFGPMGPWITTREDVPDPQTLSIKLRLNGSLMQDSNTAHMVFSTAELISYVSRLGLDSGDVIATGTPAGVGAFRKPPVYLQPGDLVSAEIEGLGHLENRIAEADIAPLDARYALAATQ
ncbi:MAG: fumarylacetoacetate hydrolase family protein [Candidatus Dormibacteraceae bacterium]